MAKRGKAISVKIATVKVIKALEATLAQKEKDYAGQEAKEAKFEKLKEKWNKEMGLLAIKHFAKAERVSTSVHYSGRIIIDLDIPTGTFVVPDEPERDFEVFSKWQFNETKEELENAIRILKMTDEETVSTSTYQAVARYL